MNPIQSMQEHRHFSINNLPIGMYSTAIKKKRPGIAVGDFILDLQNLSKLDFFKNIAPKKVFSQPTLNDYIALGPRAHTKILNKLKELLTQKTTFYHQHRLNIFDAQAQSIMHVPVAIGDYTDFYSSEEHAKNVGKMFRPDQDPLLPNWKHLPVAYHGRSSSIISTLTQVHRPSGQIKSDGKIIFSPTKKLDIEIELGFIIGKENKLGEPIPIDQAHEYIFGAVLLNDFSARDIQQWEYQPLGPFLSKNFATSISPWIVSIDVLRKYLTPAPIQHPEVLPYLRQKERNNFNIQIQFEIQTLLGNHKLVSSTNAKYVYWTVEQQIAHHTVNGCNLRIGDLLGTGTISGPEQGSYGSLLEITGNAAHEIKINSETRTYLSDGDTAILNGICTNGTAQVGFGELINQIIH